MIPEISLLKKDCMEGMKELMPGYVDVIVTSPPYNLGIAYGTYQDMRPRAEYLNWMGDVAAESLRVLSDAGSFYLNVGSSLKDPWIAMDVAHVFRERGWVLQNTIHWIKSIAIPREDMGRYKSVSDIAVGHYKPVKSGRFHNNCHEFIFQFTKDGTVPIDRLATGVPYQDKSNVGRWGGGDLRDRGNVWFIPYETIVCGRPHPATFPVQLPEMCIKDHGLARCRRVMDPFMGIGNTALAALRLGISCVGFEIDEGYYAEACLRVSEAREIIEREMSQAGNSF